jgi:ribulose-bisphosphate carboxylase large chain
MKFPDFPIYVSEERFHVTYRIVGNEQTAYGIAREICLEQTVELPDSMLESGDLLEKVVGRIEACNKTEYNVYRAVISYAVETTGFEFPQLLNVIFGNTSMKAGIRVEDLFLSQSLLKAFQGPRFGREGIRQLLNKPQGPIIGTALKPMGHSPEALAETAYRLALGGIEVIKEDHGLSNQSFAPYKERVERCVEAVQRANHETGRTSLYAPNVTGPVDQVLARALFAVRNGAGGIEIAPGLAGWDTIRLLRDSEDILLPIFFHPALLGTYTISYEFGVALPVLFGKIPRLAGADAVIFTNYGGRFPTSRNDCERLKEAAVQQVDGHKPVLLMPGGGMTLQRITEIVDFYGQDVIILISGGLFSSGTDLVENCRSFRRTIEGS